MGTAGLLEPRNRERETYTEVGNVGSPDSRLAVCAVGHRSELSGVGGWVIACLFGFNSTQKSPAIYLVDRRLCSPRMHKVILFHVMELLLTSLVLMAQESQYVANPLLSDAIPPANPALPMKAQVG